MAATNMTTQNKDITSMVAGLDGKYRPHDLAGLTAGGLERRSYMAQDFEEAILEINPSGTTPQSRDLWAQYPSGENAGTTVDNATLTFDTGNKVSGTRSLLVTMSSDDAGVKFGAPYIHFYPNDGNWRNGWDIWQNEEGRGTWALDTYNRMEAYIKTPSQLSAAGGGQFNMSIGTYISSDPSVGAEEGGGHFYHRFDLQSDRWMKIVLDAHPSHERGAAGNVEHGDKTYPTAAWDGVRNYMDQLNRFYFDIENGKVSAEGTVWNFDSVRFYQEPYTEDEDKVYSMSGCYDSGTNELFVGWNRRKDEGSLNPSVAYSFSDIHALGFDNATSAGTVTPLHATDYNQMEFRTTGITMGSNTSIFVAVRQAGETLFKQIEIRLDL